MFLLPDIVCFACKVEEAIVVALAQQRRANSVRLSISGMTYELDDLVTFSLIGGFSSSP